MKTKIIAILTILSVIPTACEKELDFSYHNIDPILVIEGTLTDDGARVALSYTTPMGEPINRNHLTDADVTLTDLTDGTARSLSADKEGVFTNSNGGITGHEYELRVVSSDEVYTSRCIMPRPTRIISLEFQWIKMPYDHVAVLQTRFTDADTPDDCYWIRIFRNDKPYKWLLSDDSRAIDGVISEVTMTTRRDIDEEDEEDILRDGDIVSVSVAPISRQMFDYLTALQANSNGPAMFSGSFALGYFLAAPLATSSITFHPEDLPTFSILK